MVFSVVKHEEKKLEGIEKVTGRAVYTDDMDIPRMAYAMILRSPYASAQVIDIDLNEAKKIPGYLGILLSSDITEGYYNSSGNPATPLLFKDEKVLTDTPKCLGDRVLCVAAESPNACLDVLRAIKVKYDVLTPFFTIEEALDKKNPPIQPHIADDNILFQRIAEIGDVKRGFEDSDLIMEGEFYVPPMQHVPMEPTACICDFSDGENLTIWSNSQTIFQERRILSELFDIPEKSIRIIKPTVGGGFGARQQLHSQPVAALMSKKIKRPVKLIHSREDEMFATAVRHEAKMKLRFGMKNDGRMLAFQADYYLNTGCYTTHGPTVLSSASRRFQYNVPNYYYNGYCLSSNHASAGAFRGYGSPQLFFGREIMVDRIAQKLGLDPIKLRVMNHVSVGGYLPNNTSDVASCEIEQCANICSQLQEKIDAEEGLIESDEIKQAWGVAFGCHGSGPSSRDGLSSAIVTVNGDGTVQLMVGSCDIGQGSETAMSQIAAERLGIPLKGIKIIAADTGCTPYETGTYASSQTYVCGNAVLKACDAVIENMKQYLKKIYQETVFFENNRFIVGHESFLFSEAVRKITFNPLGGLIIGSAAFKADQSPVPFAVCFAKVEYNKRANGIKLLHIIEAVDVGTPINPQMVKGQIEGGVVQGIGYTLTEHIEVNRVMQKPLSSDLLHYKIPIMGGLPKIHAIISDSYDPTGPFGAKSVGELTTVPVAPAIANAVRRASGQEISRLPLCRQFILL